MNSDFILEHSKAMAARSRAEAKAAGAGTKPDLDRKIGRAWVIAYGRTITDEERSWARAFLDAQLAELAHSKAGSDRELAVLTNLCQQLLTSNEFLYVD